MNIKLLILIIAAFYSSSMHAQSEETDSLFLNAEIEEVLITGTRFSIPTEKSGKSIYKFEEKDLRRNAGKTVADLLNEVPGIQIDGNFSSPGTNISYNVRGSRNKSTLILIDGVPLNDPSGINPFYDLRLLSISQVESIEVLKGGLSTLYGTGASAAVINIKLQDLKSEALSGMVDVNYGSFKTANASVRVGGKSNAFSYMLSGNFSDSEGFSSALEPTGQSDFDKDGFQKRNGLIKLAYMASDKFSIKTELGIDRFEADYDDGSFFDGENIQMGEMLRVGIHPSYIYEKGTIELKTTYAINENEFISSFPVVYDGRNLQADLSNKHRISESITGFWGLNYQQQSYQQKDAIEFGQSKFSSVAPYASVLYQITEGLNLHLGSRLNQHSTYGSKMVYNINPMYAFSITETLGAKLRASLATSYITPTGFQLFSFFGNPDLKPEESTNIELGIGFDFMKRFNVDLAYFTRDEESTIDFVSEFDDNGNFIGGAYQNVGDSRSIKGLEGGLRYKLMTKIELAGNYTYIHTSNNPSAFYRIPKHKLGASFHIQPIDNLEFSFKYNFTGTRTTFDFFSFSEIELENFGLIDTYIQQTVLDDKLILYAAVNNILDTDFVGVYGFTTRGRNFNLGMRYNFLSRK